VVNRMARQNPVSKEKSRWIIAQVGVCEKLGLDQSTQAIC
jgi:hypothetical protein